MINVVPYKDSLTAANTAYTGVINELKPLGGQTKTSGNIFYDTEDLQAKTTAFQAAKPDAKVDETQGPKPKSYEVLKSDLVSAMNDRLKGYSSVLSIRERGAAALKNVEVAFKNYCQYTTLQSQVATQAKLQERAHLIASGLVTEKALTENDGKMATQILKFQVELKELKTLVDAIEMQRPVLEKAIGDAWFAIERADNKIGWMGKSYTSAYCFTQALAAYNKPKADPETSVGGSTKTSLVNAFRAKVGLAPAAAAADK